MVKCPGCGEENPPKFRLCGYCGTPLATAAAPAVPHEVRKTVTIIFCDLKGSTALGEHLDAEALHEVKERYFASMAAAITRHGGKIEKYIGDAIMAVFGLPRAHEDDALRAVRAAAEMHEALDLLNIDLRARYGIVLANRTGINTGEVVANDDPGADQKLATGDAVNVTARLEQAAGENCILLGETTWRLVRDAVEARPVEPLTLKGKAQPVGAWQLLSVHGLDGVARRHDQPVVGRDEELRQLAAAWQDVTGQRQLRMVTLVGDAGVGKSRLVREVIERIATGARLLVGRCLPYGEGITFWPLLMMLRAAAAIDDADTPESAVQKLRAVVRDDEVADRLAAATGLGAGTYPLPETYWAARRFLESQAARGPVVLFIDDIHWAEHAFLGGLEYLLSATGAVPVLVLATARYDLIEEHPEWGTQPNSLRLMLRPLDKQASAQVVANLLGDAALPPEFVERVVGAAEGNPLYAEQMLSMLVENGALKQQDGRWVATPQASAITVPPTIHALLEARLDKLATQERATVEPAAVIGLEFPQPAVESLAPLALREGLAERLGTLVRKRFIRPAGSGEREAVYRFHHHLVRETVYNGLLKRARANLHLEFVRWADRVNAEHDRGREFEAILGYHLEQAHRYLRELGPLDDQGRAIGADAARRLTSAGRRADAHGDLHAAANLLQRAVAVLPPDDAGRLALLPELAEARVGIGDFDGAKTVLDEARARAAQAGDRRIEQSAKLIGVVLGLYAGQDRDDWSRHALRTAEEAIPLLQAEGAHDELATAWRLIVLVHGIAGRYSAANEAVQQSIAHARKAGNERLVARNGMVCALNALNGAMPVPEAILECEKLLADGLGDRQVECAVLCVLAQLRAMAGDAPVARELCQRGRSVLRELGQGVYAASTGIDLARVMLHGGDLAFAEAEVRADHDFLASKGETYFLSTMAALLARIVREQGRDDEALALSRTAEAATAADDTESQALWRMARAPLLARAGDVATAETLAREAIALVGSTEGPVLQADARAELATVLEIAGRADEARGMWEEAAALYQGKGNVVMAERCHARLAALGAA